MMSDKMNKASGIEIIEFPAADYMPLKDYQGWRVAVLRFCENTRLERIRWMQKHLETDEVFVLLDGRCRLILAGEGTHPQNFIAIEMEPHKLYNIKRGVWHNHILDKSGEVLIVENQDTTDDNSPTCYLTETEITNLKQKIKGF